MSAAASVVAVLGAGAFLAVPQAQAAAPAWKLTVTPIADYFLAPGDADHLGVYLVRAENVGNAPTSGPITIEDTLPPELEATGVKLRTVTASGFLGEDIHAGLCPTLLKCTYPGALKPHESLRYAVLANDLSAAERPLTDSARVSGGGVPAPLEASATNAASPDPPFGIFHFGAELSDSSLTNPYTQAGGHPYQFVTEFGPATYSGAHEIELGAVNQFWDGNGISSLRDPRAISADLPPGLLANPQGVPHCSLAHYFLGQCQPRDVVGAAVIKTGSVEQALEAEAVYNLQPNGAYPGELGTTYLKLPFILITAGIRSGSDYGVTATSIAAAANLTNFRLTLWGVPADPAHDAQRWCPDLAHFGCGAEVPPTPFLTMPTECSGTPPTINARYDTWQVPGEYASASDELTPLDGCNQLSFEPTIEARPTTNLADSPSGLDFKLHVPQNHAGPEGKEDPEGVATPSLKEAVVTFPAGLTVNPSSGDGLQGCSEAEVGLHSEEPAHCPDAAKLGNVEVDTPLLNEPLGGLEPSPGRVGALYLATPHQNPTNSLLAGYIVVEGQGVKVKLAGSFEADPVSGQITARFLQNPQLPFEDFKFNVFGGARGALRTPPTCGSYETTSVLTPYSAPESGPAAEPKAEFETTSGAGGGACPNAASEEPNKPVFHAGTESPQAGIYSPFSLKLVRQDGEQEIKAIDTTLPPGLVGKLAGIAECSDAQIAAAADPHHSGAAEQASPSCPLNSEVGTVDVAAGAGPTPLNVLGHAYLAGPYKGAPLSLAIITPAVAGPFDLGTVVVRTALYVNPETAQIHAVSDPIPTILEGIPLDVRSVTLKMARPNFTLNPTNCEPLSFTGSALSVLNVAAPLTQSFQVGGCSALPFKPKLALSLKGGTKRAQNPALKAVLTAKPGEANIAKAQVTLPHSEFLDNAHIKTVCTRVQFAANECPAASIYGHARAITPLLEKPLEGPVYLRSSSNKLPDLVAALGGQINVVLDGRVDSVHARLRNSFEAVPDAPVSKFVLEMQGGKKGLLVNSENICKSSPRATVKFTGQNGKSQETNPLLKVRCPKHHKRKHQPRA